MKYVVEMDSRAKTDSPDFGRTGSAIRKLIREDTQTYRQHGDHISLLVFFFQMKKFD
jgi:hypothetical protein